MERCRNAVESDLTRAVAVVSRSYLMKTVLLVLIAAGAAFGQCVPIDPTTNVSTGPAVINNCFTTFSTGISTLQGQETAAAAAIATLQGQAGSAGSAITVLQGQTTSALAAITALQAATNLVSSLFMWTQTPGGSISGVSSVSLMPCPLGVNGTNVGQNLYISGGTGTAEAVRVTGGSCTGGSSIGTITFTAVNAHSGGWTIASDSCGIYEAANTGPGITVHVPTGTCIKHKPIYVVKSFVRVTGTGSPGQLGGGTVISDTLGTDGIVVDSAVSGAMDGVEVDHIFFTSPASTGGYALKAGGLSFGSFHDIGAEPYPNAIALTNPTEGTTYNDLKFQAIQGDAININTGSGGAGTFNNVKVGCNRMSGTNGIHALSAHGIMMNGVYVTGCGMGWLSDSSTAQVSYVDLVDVYFDTGPQNGINLVPTGSGSVYVFKGTHIATSGFSGVGLHVGTGGTVGGVHLDQYTSNINMQQGVLIEGGTDITLNNCQVNGNSNPSPSSFNGIDITGGDGVQITHCASGAYDGQINSQAIGLNVSGTTTNLTLKDNLLNNNLIASLVDTSTGAFKWISDNQGVGVPTIASAAAFNPGTLDETTVDVTGTTNITSILRPWDQRSLTFVKADTGSLTVMGATLAQNGKVDCVYVNGVPGWFCK